MGKSALDKDLKKVVRLEEATYSLSRAIAMPGLAVLFLLAVVLVVSLQYAEGPLALYVIAATLVGGYMALNIGANDVANNMGPAVGGRVVTMTTALVIAAVCETAGAILAGGDVVDTISKGIVQPVAGTGARDFILIMMAGLMAAAVWIHLATYLGAPVSTTHAVVGGVLGSALTAFGPSVVAWPMMGAIAASWVISPVLGGLVAAGILAFIKFAIIRRPDRVAAARRWVPLLIGVMIGVFTTYMVLKGFSRIWRPSIWLAAGLGVAGFVIAWTLSHPWIRARSEGMSDRRKNIAGLFSIPLIFATGLLSFAHGANDVANAVGPLAAIVAAAASGEAAPDNVELPIWVLVIGAVGISLGLALFGPRLIRTVGEKITKLDAIRAFCVALSAGATVLVASALGLPVSSTHIAVGGVFGVGFLREALSNQGIPNPAVHPRTRFLNVSALNKTPEEAVRRQQTRWRRRLVRRRHALGIGAAWIITVPAAALLAALFYLAMRAALSG